MLSEPSRPVSPAILITVIAMLAVTWAIPRSAFGEVRASDCVDGRRWSESGIPKSALPDVGMKSGALVTEDGRVLWSRRIDDRRAIASLTKVMTAVVALERGQLSEQVTIPASSARVGEATSYLRPGERLALSELLEALLIKSGNDAAVAVAMHVAGGEEPFVDLMNDKAARLGLSRTQFKNVHGLDEEGHYSTASDVAVLVRYAMTNPEFRRIAARKTAFIGTGKRAERIESTNLLLGNYQGLNGVKTGWTYRAGYCVVDSARRGDVELYAVVLGASGEMTRFRDARELLDFGFAHYRTQELASAGTVVAEAPVSDYIDLSVPAAISRDVTATVFDPAGGITRDVTVSRVRAPVDLGERVGVVRFTQGGRVIASVPLVAARHVARPSLLQRFGIAFVRAWRAFTGGPSQ